MNRLPQVSTGAELREMRRLLWGGIGILLIGGLFWTQTLDGVAGYVLVTIAAALPMLLWLRLGAPGVPVLPAVAVFYYLYFAVPVARENFDKIASTPEEVLRAAATAALFLVAATAAWWLITRERIRRPKQAVVEFISNALIRQVIVGGLVVGIMFQLAIMSGWLNGLGTFFGVVRAVGLSVAAISCYLVGCCRARGLLNGQLGGFVLAATALLIALAWTSLFLVIGMQFLLAAMLGYVITSKRIPWKIMVPLIALMFVLHAGKAEMRDRYWASGAEPTISTFEMPALYAEWFIDGTQAVANGQVQQDLFDRASLLYRLIDVQQLTPAYVPYLDGETYLFLGSYLIPRFLDPDKTFSQAGTALLNIRYGVQTLESAYTTTIGWGVVAEAYANFGYGGVVVVGLLFGALAAVFTCWSAGAPPLAMSTLFAVAALVTMTNVEADFSYLLVNLWQALAAMLIFFVPVKFLSGGSAPRRISLMKGS